jgi:8-oxo-dGTP diphosphatase
MVTVDAVVFTVRERQMEVLLVARKYPPYAGNYALPGGFVEPEEPLAVAATRELYEETGAKGIYLDQFHAFGDPGRDPRGHSVSIAFMALVDWRKIELTASDDAAEARWFPLEQLPKLAFDHNAIIEYALERLRVLTRYKGVGVQILPERFTLRELQELYEIILDETLKPLAFSKRLRAMDILENAEAKPEDEGKEPFYTFRAGRVERL